MPNNNNNNKVDSRLTKNWSENCLESKDGFAKEYNTIGRLALLIGDGSSNKEVDSSRFLIEHIDWIFHLIKSDECIDDIQDILLAALPEYEAKEIILSDIIERYVIESAETFKQYSVKLKSAEAMIGKIFSQLTEDTECFCCVFPNAKFLAKAMFNFREHSPTLVNFLFEHDDILGNICQSPIGIGELIDELCFQKYDGEATVLVDYITQHERLSKLINYNQEETNPRVNFFHNIKPQKRIRRSQIDFKKAYESSSSATEFFKNVKCSEEYNESLYDALVTTIFSAISEDDQLYLSVFNISDLIYLKECHTPKLNELIDGSIVSSDARCSQLFTHWLELSLLPYFFPIDLVSDILLKYEIVESLFDNSEQQLLILSELAKNGCYVLGDPNQTNYPCRLIDMPTVNFLQKFMSELEVSICSELMVDPEYFPFLYRCYPPELWQNELDELNNINKQESTEESNNTLSYTP